MCSWVRFLNFPLPERVDVGPQSGHVSAIHNPAGITQLIRVCRSQLLLPVTVG